MERYICVDMVGKDMWDGEYTLYHSIQKVEIGTDPRKIAKEVTTNWDIYDYDEYYEGKGKFKPKYFFVHPSFAKGLLNYTPPTKNDYGVSAFAAADVLVDICRHFEIKRTTIKDILTKYDDAFKLAIAKGWKIPSREVMWSRYRDHFEGSGDGIEDLVYHIRNECYTLNEEIYTVIGLYERDVDDFLDMSIDQIEQAVKALEKQN